MDWFYIDASNTPVGPIDQDSLIAATASMTDFYVFRAGMCEWMLASQVPQFQHRFSKQSQVQGASSQPVVAAPPVIDQSAIKEALKHPIQERAQSIVTAVKRLTTATADVATVEYFRKQVEQHSRKILDWVDAELKKANARESNQDRAEHIQSVLFNFDITEWDTHYKRPTKAQVSRALDALKAKEVDDPSTSQVLDELDRLFPNLRKRNS